MMDNRSYTVKELNDLREVIECKVTWGSYTMPKGDAVGWGLRPDVKAKTVEEMVRTHMQAGHTADELLASGL